MELTLSELRELTQPQAKTCDSSPRQPAALRIVILHRGWVVIGRVTSTLVETTITNAAVIRIWGTTKGLGEISLGGPTSKTVLDPCGTLRVHPLAIVGQLDCNEEKWNGR